MCSIDGLYSLNNILALSGFAGIKVFSLQLGHILYELKQSLSNSKHEKIDKYVPMINSGCQNPNIRKISPNSAVQAIPK